MRTLEVAPNVHQLTIRTTNLLVIAGRALTLVDTGFPGSSTGIVDFIRNGLHRSPEEIRLVVVTHNHVDHMGSIPELRPLADFQVAAHRDGLATPDGEPSYRENVRRVLRVSLLAGVRRRVVLEDADVELPLAGDEVLDALGGLRVVHTPGHTPGSISLYSPRHRLLAVGDALQRRRLHVRLPSRAVSMDMGQARASVEKMARLDVDTMCFGHGQPVTEGAGEMLEGLLSRSRAARGAGGRLSGPA